ncbi:MAG: MFS transporter [Chloroflexota bacterium]|nr:MFS transporter [Chloroflexota bacterium]
MIALLRMRGYALVWWAALASRIGNWALVVALHVYLFEQTGSPLAVSGVFVAYYIPGLAFGSVAGVFADRWDRRRTMIAANVAQAVAVLFLLLIGPSGPLWFAYIVAFADASMAQLFAPADNALLPRLVPDDRLMSANVVNSVNDHLARTVGPAIAGFVVAVGGLHAAALVDSASFVISAALIALVRPRDLRDPADATLVPRTRGGDASATPGRNFGGDLIDGLRAIRSSTVLSRLLLVVSVTAIAWSFVQTLLVPFVVDVIHAGAETVGVALAVRGVAGLAAGLALSSIADRLPRVATIAVSTLASGVVLIGQSIYPATLVLVAAMAVIGPAFVVASTSQRTMMQAEVGDRYRGRVFGGYATANALVILLGNVGAGLAAEVAGIVPVLVASGALFMLGGVLAITVIPERQSQSAV